MEDGQVDGNLAYLEGQVEAQGKVIVDLTLRLGAVEKELAGSVKRRDSVDIGTPSKGGNLKVYFDASAPSEENDRMIEEGRRMLSAAAGTSQVQQGA
jgi:hypothetical protein